MKKGYFITFEGIDGCGKTTQLEKVKVYLENQGFDVVTTLEPGSLELGKQIRNILLHSENPIPDKCEMFLFLADRANHIKMFIEPNLYEGKIVLCDRHTDSTLAYQGFARGQNINQLKQLNNIAVSNITPDLTLLYDVTIETSLKRIGKEKDRMENQGLDFYEKVKNGYLKLQKENQERIKLINANDNIDKVFSDTKKHIDNLLNLRSING